MMNLLLKMVGLFVTRHVSVIHGLVWATKQTDRRPTFLVEAPQSKAITRGKQLEYKGHFTHETERPWPLHFKHYRRWKRRSRDQRSMWMQNGCTVYMDSYVALNGSCMVTWTNTFITHFLEVGLSQNCKIMALQMLTIVDLLCFIKCEDPHD